MTRDEAEVELRKIALWLPQARQYREVAAQRVRDYDEWIAEEVADAERLRAIMDGEQEAAA